MEVKEYTNWDQHYQNLKNNLLTKLRLKGNLFLNKEVSKYIEKKTNNHESFIEIGVGGGLLSKFMTKNFNECVILDKSAYALDVALKRAPKAEPILIDVFNYHEKEKFDAVASLGLAEHFHDNDMERLVFKHIEMAKPDGCVFILVPAHSKKREEVVIMPLMVKKYGYQDAFAEYKIDGFLKKKCISYEKKYVDKIPHYIWYYKVLRIIALILYLLFTLKIEFFMGQKKGNHALFFINKKTYIKS